MLKRILVGILGSLLFLGLVFGTIVVVSTLSNDDVYTSSKMESYSEVHLDRYRNIEIDVKDVDVTVMPSGSRETRIESLLYPGFALETEIKDNVLKISVKDNRSILKRGGIYTDKNSIVVYLREEDLDNGTFVNKSGDFKIDRGLSFAVLNIRTDSGNIETGSKVVGESSITTNSGSVLVIGTTIQSLTINTDSGEVNVDNTVISYDISIKSNSGNVDLDIVSAQIIDIETTSGNVSGAITKKLTYTVFTSTGQSNCPIGEGYGTCNVRTDSGNIFFTYVAR